MVHTLPLFYFQRYCRLNHSVKISDGFPLSHVEYDSSLQLLMPIYQFASFSRKHSLHLAFFFLFSFLFLFLSFFFTFIISSNLLQRESTSRFYFIPPIVLAYSSTRLSSVPPSLHPTSSISCSSSAGTFCSYVYGSSAYE